MVLLLAALLWQTTLWQTLDARLAPFMQQFNNYADRARLVMLVSPT